MTYLGLASHRKGSFAFKSTPTRFVNQLPLELRPKSNAKVLKLNSKKVDFEYYY